MSLSRTLLGALVIAVCLPRPASAAVSVIVPDEQPTLEAAFATGADTILVRSGRYLERPVFTHSVALVAADPDLPRPRLDGLVLRNDEQINVYVRDMAFEGSVDLDTSNRPRQNLITFERCTLDSGLTHRDAGDTQDIALLTLRDSRMHGSLNVQAAGSLCERDTVEAGGLFFGAEDRPVIRGCRLTGPGTVAILVAVGEYLSGAIVGNHITGPYDGGIEAHHMNDVTIEDNRIESCTTGMWLEGEASIVRDNDVRNCATGIQWLGTGSKSVLDNRVVGSTEHGIVVEAYSFSQIQGNVVGRSGGDGIRLVTSDAGYSDFPIELLSNTSYGNGGAGFALRFDGPEGAYPTLLRARTNIGYGNGAFGLVADAPYDVDFSCNDWFANDSGAVSVGVAPGDLEIDPKFCDVANDSVGLQEGSPVVAVEGCGLIGARGVACVNTATLVQRFEVEARIGEIELRWILSGDPVAIAVERRDANAGAWRSIAVTVTNDGGTSIARDHDVLPGATYEYRLAWRAPSGEWLRSAPLTAIAGSLTPTLTLAPVAPNPAAGPMQVQWEMPREADVSLRVYDVLGREISVLARGRFAAGQHAITWTGPPSRSAGLFFVRLACGGEVVSRSVLVRR